MYQTKSRGARIAQLEYISIDRRSEPHFRRVFSWYGCFATNTSVGSDHHSKKNRGPNLWITVKTTRRLLNILSFLEKSFRVSAGDV